MLALDKSVFVTVIIIFNLVREDGDEEEQRAVVGVVAVETGFQCRRRRHPPAESHGQETQDHENQEHDDDEGVVAGRRPVIWTKTIIPTR